MTAPAVLLIATGGTIASRPVESEGVRAVLTGADLLATVPEVDDVAAVEVVDITHGPSWNFTPDQMAAVAIAACGALADGEIAGVVVTHGTDTVEESAWVADLYAGAAPHGPIVFTCAMRHAAEVGADGPRNLLDALRVATDPAARGIGSVVVANGEVHPARWVTKTDTTAVATFQSPGVGLVGRVVGAGARLRAAWRPGVPAATGIDPAVALVRSYGGIDGAVLDWHLDRGVHGVVIDATGAGNVNADLVPGIERATAAAVPVVIASRCLSGPVAPIYGGPGGGATVTQLGAVGAGDLSPGKARLALMVALAVDPRPDAVRDWFARLLV
jgi:L-asparaginase